MKIPVNRQQPGNRKCRFYVPNQNSGEGRGSLRPGDLRGGSGPPSRPNRGEVCVLVFGGIDAPGLLVVADRSIPRRLADAAMGEHSSVR